jgi:hypothetical protein
MLWIRCDEGSGLKGLLHFLHNSTMFSAIRIMNKPKAPLCVWYSKTDLSCGRYKFAVGDKEEARTNNVEPASCHFFVIAFHR